MSNSKTYNTEKYADVFKALSNPHRLKIFMRLARCGQDGMACCSSDRPNECVGDLVSDLGIAPSTVSHHLKELYRAGLIRTRRQGQRIECSANMDTISDLSDFFKPNGSE